MSEIHAQGTRSALPLGQAIRALPGQYIKVITNPSVQFFSQAKEQASWSSTWVQLIVLGILSAILAVIANLISPPLMTPLPGMDPATQRTATMATTAIFIVIGTPISFMISAAIIYWLARLFKGDGSYLQQAYTLALFGVPMVLLSSLLQLIPATSNWLPYLPHLYSIVLLALSLMAVHHLSSRRATIIVLLPLALLVVLTIAAIAATMMH